MEELRRFLRYGIAGYMILFCDIFFIASFIGLKDTFEYIGKPGIGAIFVTVGLPLGWLCYQLTDWDLHRENSTERDRDHIRRVHDINNDEYPGSSITLNAILAIENTTIPLDSIERRYSNHYLARKVMMFFFLLVVFTTYFIIGIIVLIHAWDSEWVWNLSKDNIYFGPLILSLLLPVIIYCIARKGFSQVKDAHDLTCRIELDNPEKEREIIRKLGIYHRMQYPDIVRPPEQEGDSSSANEERNDGPLSIIVVTTPSPSPDSTETSSGDTPGSAENLPGAVSYAAPESGS